MYEELGTGVLVGILALRLREREFVQRNQVDGWMLRERPTVSSGYRDYKDTSHSCEPILAYSAGVSLGS